MSLWPSRPHTAARAAYRKKHCAAKYVAGLCVYGGCRERRDAGHAKCAYHRELMRKQFAAWYYKGKTQ